MQPQLAHRRRIVRVNWSRYDALFSNGDSGDARGVADWLLEGEATSFFSLLYIELVSRRSWPKEGIWPREWRGGRRIGDRSGGSWEDCIGLWFSIARLCGENWRNLGIEYIRGIFWKWAFKLILIQVTHSVDTGTWKVRRKSHVLSITCVGTNEHFNQTLTWIKDLSQ